MTLAPGFISFKSNDVASKSQAEPESASVILRSGKVPLYSGERLRDLEERVRQAHHLLGQIKTSHDLDSHDEKLYTVVKPSLPESLMQKWKRTYSCDWSKGHDTAETQSSFFTEPWSSLRSSNTSFLADVSEVLPEQQSAPRDGPSLEVLECTDNSSDWGYFVDVVDESHRPSLATCSPSYRRFMKAEIKSANSVQTINRLQKQRRNHEQYLYEL